jgi:diguanylate cyclase (GGDEF)-like protein
MKIKRLNLFIIILTLGITAGLFFSYIISTLNGIDSNVLNLIMLGCTLTGATVSIVNYFILDSIIDKLNTSQKIVEGYKYKAFTDDLTLLLNRRAFDKDMNAYLDKKGVYPITMAFIDIDNFRMYNNKYGHTTGDIVLKGVASELKANVRKCDRVYRYGGEEFVIIFENADKEKGLVLSDRIRQRVNGINIAPGNSVSVSIGVASCPEDADTIKDLIKIADDALYCAKGKGKNVVSIFDKMENKNTAENLY